MLKTGDLDRPAHPECPPANRRDTQRKSYSPRFGNRPNRKESMLSTAGIRRAYCGSVALAPQTRETGVNRPFNRGYLSTPVCHPSRGQGPFRGRILMIVFGAGASTCWSKSEVLVFSRLTEV